MIYGMEDNDEFALVTKPQLNKKKVFLIVGIILSAIVIVSVIIFSIVNKSKESSENIAVEDKELLENNYQIENNKQIDSNEKNGEWNSIEENQNKINTKNPVILELPEHDVNEIKNSFLPKQNENAKTLIKDIYYSDEKQVYLTFDDGPSKNITPQILDILKQYDVKATFFVLGARVELYPDTLKREFSEGHYIANHGYSHKYSQIYENKDTVFQEYIDCENSIKQALGREDYNSYLFRFPGGSSGGHYSSVKAEARELFDSYGIAYTNWNCLTGDAENKKTKEACIQEMIDTKSDQNSIILLMHDANDKQQTVDALPEIIEYYKNEGYTFKNFYEIFK